MRPIVAPLLLVFLLSTCTQAQGVEAAFNREIQDVWDRLRPEAERELRAQAAAQVGALVREKKLEVDLVSVRKVELDIRKAPGLRVFDRQYLELRVPATDTWRIAIEGDVEVRFRFLGRWRKLRLPVRIEVRRLCVEAKATFDWTDPVRPKLSSIGRPKIRFKLRLRSRGNLFKGLLLRALTPVGKIVAKRMIKKALDDLRPMLATLEAGLPGPIPGDGAPLLTDTGGQAPISDIARGVDAKIRSIHLPHGIILPMRMDVPAFETWEQAYATGGAGNPGVATPKGDGGDSSAWNAHYMASQGFRYAVTGDATALDNVKTCLQAFDDMLALNGNTGLMARVAAPEASTMGQSIRTHYDPARIVTGTIRGVPWVSTNGNYGDSRDVYIEIVYSLAAIYEVISEPTVRADAARILTQMVDYLVRHDWIIDEDRDPFAVAQGTKTFPTFWLGVPAQKITMLVVASKISPARFGPELARWSSLSQMAWLSQWMGTMSLSDYFGFNLSHVSYYTFFKYETDQTRWQDLARAYRIMRRFVGHHRNAYFDAIHLAIDPADTRYRGSVREALQKFVQRPHRKVAPANLDLSVIQWTNVSFPAANAGLGVSNAPSQVSLPSEPLSPELWHPEDDFIWQRSPFKPYSGAGQGDPHIESTGLDLVAPFWLARYHGVRFP